MSSQAEDPNLLVNGDLKIRDVLEITDEQNASAALQIVFVDGSCLVCTVWTDWSLRVEKRVDSEVPNYLWPPENYSQKSIGLAISSESTTIECLTTSSDEFGALMEVNFRIADHNVTVKSSAGEMEISTILL